MNEIIVFPLEGEDGSIQWGARFIEIKGCSGGGHSPYEAIRELFVNYKIHLRALKENGMLQPVEYMNKVDILLDANAFGISNFAG